MSNLNENSLFFIGVDGGASKCKVRIESEDGSLLGEELSGPANIRLSTNGAWESIYSAINGILRKHDLSLQNQQKHFHAGMGLAGCEVVDAYHAFCQYPHPFKSLKVTTDSHTACLGAHDGQDGSIIIIGTGVVGFQIDHGQTFKVGGWGFPHDDEGGGAWLGLEAVRLTLQWLDGRLKDSNLAKMIYAHFNHNQNALVHWAHESNSTRFATLAPFVIEAAQTNDSSALLLMQRAGDAINKIGNTLFAAQKDQTKLLSCALIGGVTPFIIPFLNDALRARLADSKQSPAYGAIKLIRDHIANQELKANAS